MADAKEKTKKDEVKKLVIARLEVLSSDKKISIGSSGEFTKEELIEHVEKEDSIGEKITEIQMEFLQSLKEDVFYEQDTSNNETKA